MNLSTTARTALFAVVLTAAGMPAAMAAEMPGVIDLSGTWRVGVEAADGGGRRWLESALPATWAQLQLTGHSGPVWFRRAIVLPPAWQETLAPGGLAVMVGPAKHGAYDGQVSWNGPWTSWWWCCGSSSASTSS